MMLISAVGWVARLIWPYLVPLIGLTVLVPIEWLWSVKDDLTPSDDHYVHPVGLVSKLIVLVFLSSLLIISVINLLKRSVTPPPSVPAADKAIAIADPAYKRDTHPPLSPHFNCVSSPSRGFRFSVLPPRHLPPCARSKAPWS